MIFRDLKIITTEIKSREIFFSFWEVNFDMIDIKPSVERSTELCRLGSALLESPECLLQSVCWACEWEWQKKLLIDMPKRVLHAFLDY